MSAPAYIHATAPELAALRARLARLHAHALATAAAWDDHVQHVTTTPLLRATTQERAARRVAAKRGARAAYARAARIHLACTLADAMAETLAPDDVR